MTLVYSDLWSNCQQCQNIRKSLRLIIIKRNDFLIFSLYFKRGKIRLILLLNTNVKNVVSVKYS